MSARTTNPVVVPIQSNPTQCIDTSIPTHTFTDYLTLYSYITQSSVFYISPVSLYFYLLETNLLSLCIVVFVFSLRKAKEPYHPNQKGQYLKHTTHGPWLYCRCRHCDRRHGGVTVRRLVERKREDTLRTVASFYRCTGECIIDRSIDQQPTNQSTRSA